MPDIGEPFSLRERCLRDIAKLTLLALVAVPVYLLLNQYWQSLLRLVTLYVLLTLFCLRVGEVVHRLFRRLPAEVPPWHAPARKASESPWFEQRFGAAEAIRSARQDPQYVQTVLKPRLRRLLMHRLQLPLETAIEALDERQKAQVDPQLLEFLRRQEPTGLWTRYGGRRQRFDEVSDSLRRLEAL
jgi:hypothetical protein